MSPRYTYDTKADYDLISYKRAPGNARLAGTNAVRLNYHRLHEFPWHETLAAWLTTDAPVAWRLDASSRVAIIGSGFPWTQEALHATVPLGRIASVDTGAYIQANFAATETAEHRAEITNRGLDPDTGDGATILGLIDNGHARNGGASGILSFTVSNADISGGGGRAAVRQLCGGRPTFTYTEMMIESLFEAEILDRTADMKLIGNASTTNAHMVVTRRRNHLSFDIRTLAAWRTFFDANGHSDVVLIDATSFEVG